MVRAQLATLTRTEEGSQREPADVHLDRLRLFHHSQVVNVGLLDLADMIEPAEAYACLSDIAELCVEDALDFAMGQLAARHLDASDRYVVVAMGKLATRELAYGTTGQSPLYRDHHRRAGRSDDDRRTPR